METLSPDLIAQFGIAAPIFALLTWFLRRSLTILDERLAAIADRIGTQGDTHRAEVHDLTAAHAAEVKSLGEAHSKAVEALIARERELTDKLLKLKLSELQAKGQEQT